jgi:hypothetical protein
MVDPRSGIEYGSVNVCREDPLRSSGQVKAEGRSNHYFQFPVPMWEESYQMAEQGMPATIHSIVGPAPDGSYQITMNMALTSEELRNKLVSSVKEMDGEYATQNDTTSPRVHFWPVTHAVILCHDPLSQREIGFAISGDLNSARRIECHFIVQGEDKDRFIEGVADGALQFTPYFQGRLVENASGRITMTASTQLSEQVRAKLSSEQLSGTAPIFQNQANNVMQEVTESINRIVLGDSELTAALNSADLFGRLFASLDAYSIEELMDEYDGLEERFNEYIRPHLIAFQEEKARSGITISIDEETKTTGRASGGGFSFMGFGASKSNAISESDLKRLEEITGVSFKRSENGTKFAPHSIRVSKLKQGWQKIDLDVNDSIFRSLGPDYSYIPGTAIDGLYTYSDAMASLGLPGQRNTSSSAEIARAQSALRDVARMASRQFQTAVEAESESTHQLLRDYESYVRQVRSITEPRQVGFFFGTIKDGEKIFPNGRREDRKIGREEYDRVKKKMGTDWSKKVRSKKPVWNLYESEHMKITHPSELPEKIEALKRATTQLIEANRNYENERRKLITDEVQTFKNLLRETRTGERVYQRVSGVPLDDTIRDLIRDIGMVEAMTEIVEVKK